MEDFQTITSGATFCFTKIQYNTVPDEGKCPIFGRKIIKKKKLEQKDDTLDYRKPSIIFL